MVQERSFLIVKYAVSGLRHKSPGSAESGCPLENVLSLSVHSAFSFWEVFCALQCNIPFAAVFVLLFGLAWHFRLPRSCDEQVYPVTLILVKKPFALRRAEGVSSRPRRRPPKAEGGFIELLISWLWFVGVGSLFAFW